jgi:Protein of unknown function (DUF2877)
MGPPREGLVLARFPTALYLSVGRHHEIVPVVASDALLLPTATRLSAPASDVDWGVEPGDPVSVGGSGIRLPGWRVRAVREWRPARVHAIPTLAHPRLLSVLADSLATQVLPPVLVDQASAVCRAARRGGSAEVRRLTGRLVGAGPGLTPSGDDVLCGVLLALAGVGDPAPLALLGATVQELWARTTWLSASLLDCARRGYAVPSVVTLVRCTLSGDLAGARAALGPTLAIGHWSGPDLVAGLAGSLNVLAGANRIVAPMSLSGEAAWRVRPARTKAPDTGAAGESSQPSTRTAFRVPEPSGGPTRLVAGGRR